MDYMLHIAGSLPAMRKSNTKVQKKMHICKSPRRKIARKCIFCAGVPAYARIRAGATAQKSNSASYNFSSGRNLAKMPGIAALYLRREPARREGACRSTKKIPHLQVLRDFFYYFVRFLVSLQVQPYSTGKPRGV
jgi:hypothetical protein